MRINEEVKNCIETYKVIVEINNLYTKSDPFSLNKFRDWKEDLFMEHAFNRIRGFNTGFFNPIKHLSLFQLMLLLDNFED